MRSITRDGEFRGTERYQVRRRIGSGGFGVVYQALDHQHGIDVALKVLKHLDPGALYRFKNEFRGLAGVTHPNLVGLRELVSSEEQWFFTMELIDGVTFLEHVWRGAVPGRASDEDTAPSPEPGAQAARPALPVPQVDEARLRAALSGLVQGVDALHRAGRLHRDIKPSNVLVSREGRVVLLDFGLIADVERGPAGDSTDTLVGTVAYMAPEQGDRRALTPASDWYSVGALLYECLTGRVPFIGSPVQVLLDKSRVEPAPPSTFAAGIPGDLDQLCCELLRLEPSKRPEAAEIARRVGGVSAPRSAPAPRPAPATGFVGRQEQLAELRAALDATAQGKSVALFIKGRSGMGKTALARHFLETLAERPDLTVLQGRCYQREFVPYKTLDNLVDALARKLLRLPAHQVEALLPRDVQALAQVFPVLRRVELVANAQRSVPQAPDPQELRRRAFAGLRELLARMGDRTRLVLFIDDLQWGDADGSALLAELFRPPDPPTLLLIGSYRLEDEASCLLLKAMIDAHARLSGAVELREVLVDTLSPEDAVQLARNRLGGQRADAARVAESIARESGGSPFFLDVLASSATEPRRPEVSLEQVLKEHVGRLGPEHRRLLDVIAVAGRPISRAVAYEAAGLDGDLLATLAALEAGRFLRATPGLEIETLEMFHDRLREPILSGLSPAELARLHLKLARALEASVQRDDETLARHYADGGEPELAAAHATLAAERAAEALAFDQAAFLYQWALELVRPEDNRRRALESRLGDALGLAGRGPESAAAYFRALEAPSLAALTESDALDLRRRAAEQLLRSGHTDEGLEAIRLVLEGVKLKLARSPQTARASLTWRRVRVWARGLGYTERAASEIPAETISRIDVCWAAAQGLGMVDVIRGAAFQAKHLLLALDAGEPYRVARALATEAIFAAVGGTKSEAKVNAILAQAGALAVRLDHPHALGLVRFGEAVRDLLCGRWKTAHESADQAVQIFRDRAQGVAFERVNAQLFSLWALFFMGEMRALTGRVQSLRAEAVERGDQYAVTASGLSNLALLVADEPQKARAQFEATLGKWSTRGFHLPHYWGLCAQALVDSYAGEHTAPWERLQQAWPALQGSLLLNIQHVRLLSWHVRAHSALQAALESKHPEGLLRSAEADTRRIEREKAPWADALAALLRGSLAVRRQQTAVGLAHLERAEELFRSQHMAGFAGATRWRRGEVQGGDEGAALVRSAEEWMRAQNVKNPERFSAMLTPTK